MASCVIGVSVHASTTRPYPASACSTISAIVASNCEKVIGLCTKQQPCLDGSPLVVQLRVPADQHDWGRASPGPDRRGHLEARQFGHEEVGEHGLVDARVEARQPLVPIRSQVRLMSQHLEERSEEFPQARLIIDHEHFQCVVAPVCHGVDRHASVIRVGAPQRPPDMAEVPA